MQPACRKSHETVKYIIEVGHGQYVSLKSRSFYLLLQGKFSSGFKMSCGATPQKHNTYQHITMNLCKKNVVYLKYIFNFY